MAAFGLTRYVIATAPGGLQNEDNPIARFMLSDPYLSIILHSAAMSISLLGYLWLRRGYLRSPSRAKSLLFNFFVGLVFFISFYDAVNDFDYFMALISEK